MCPFNARATVLNQPGSDHACATIQNEYDTGPVLKKLDDPRAVMSRRKLVSRAVHLSAAAPFLSKWTGVLLIQKSLFQFRVSVSAFGDLSHEQATRRGVVTAHGTFEAFCPRSAGVPSRRLGEAWRVAACLVS